MIVITEEDIQHPFDWIQENSENHSRETYEGFYTLCREYLKKNYNIDKGFKPIYDLAYSDGSSEGMRAIFYRLIDFANLVFAVYKDITNSSLE